MKNRLAVKLLLILVGVLLLSGLISALAISTTTRSAFEKLVRRSDAAAAEQLADRLADYYARRGDWRGVEELFDSISFSFLAHRMHPGMGGMSGMQRQGPMGRRPARPPAGPTGGGEMPRPGAMPASRLHLILSDRQGRVIAHTMPSVPAERVDEDLLSRGAPVEYRGSVVGYLLTGAMIDPVLGPFQQAFLGRVYRVIALSTLLAVVLGAGAGLFFIRSVTVPLKGLSEAAEGVSRGSYEPQLPAERRDEIGELSRSFLSMASSLKEADAWKKKIIADSAHELRTPVSILQGNVEMMLEGLYPIDRQRIEGLQEEIALLSRLVGELQTLARAEEGRNAYRFESEEAGELLHRVYTSSAPLAASAGVEFGLQLPDEPLRIRADRQKLIQAVSNLVHNAMQHTPRGGRVELGAEKDGDEVILYVEDTGAGIPRAERELIFERFYRLDKARNRRSGGSGLGLAIVREIVLHHGGTAAAEEPRRLSGSRVAIRIGNIGER